MSPGDRHQLEAEAFDYQRLGAPGVMSRPHG